MRLGTPNTTVESNLDPANSRACGFDADGAAHIMGILSNMYSNAPLAVLREYSCNARDSHVAAGNPEPIEVTLPTPLSPTLIVRDYGLGLSEREIVEVYANYGASTKRGRNDQVGAFGIGSKSAYTIGQTFVVTAVKAGAKTAALFTIGDDDRAAFQILSTTATDEPNGVTVSVAVDQPAEWERIARDFFATWEPGTVLIDGERPASIYDTGLRLSDRTHLPPLDHGARTQGMTVVMGDVGYPVSPAIVGRIVDATNATSRDQLHQLARTRAHLRVGIGDVDITPSREGLRDTPRTLRRLAQAMRDALDDAATVVARDVENAPSLTAAAIAYAHAERHITTLLPRNFVPTWHGQPISNKLITRHTIYTRPRRSGRCRTSADYDGEVFLNGPFLDGLLVVTDVPPTRSATVARGVKRIVENSDTIRSVMATPHDQETTGWFAYGGNSPIPTISFDDYRAKVKALAPPRQARSSQTRYLTWIDGTQHSLSADEILDEETDVLLYPEPHGSGSVFQAVSEGKVVVTLTRGQTMSAAQRRMPGAALGPDAEHGYARRVVRTMTDDDHTLIRDTLAATAIADADSLDQFLGGHIDQITNPDVLAALTTIRAVKSRHHERGRRITLLLDCLSRLDKLPKRPAPVNLRRAYPLIQPGLDHARYGSPGPTLVEHTIAYLNAAAICRPGTV